MIGPVVEYLNALIGVLGLQTHPVTELLEREDGERGEVTFPAVYERAGGFKFVNAEKSTAYHRILSLAESNDDDDSSPVNNSIITRTYSMRLVAIVPNDFYGKDDQYQADTLINALSRQLKQRNLRTLKASLGLLNVSSQPGASIRGQEVIDSEFAGVDFPRKRRLVAIDYDIELRGFSDCFTVGGCGDAEIDVTQAIIDEYCPAAAACDPASITVNGDSPALSVASGASQDIANVNSAGTAIGVRSGAVITNADMSLENPEGADTAVVVVPGDVIPNPPVFIIAPTSGAASWAFTTPALDSPNVCSGQTIVGGGTVSNIVIDGGAPVTTGTGQTFPAAAVVVSFDITGTVTTLTWDF